MTAKEIVCLDWHDGLVRGIFQDEDLCWYYLAIHGECDEQQKRVYVAIPMETDLVESFFSVGDPYLHRVGNCRTAMKASETFTKIVREFEDVVTMEAGHLHRWLMADPDLKCGAWMTDEEFAVMEGFA